MNIVKQIGDICLGKIEINVGDIGHITNCYVVFNKKDSLGILFDPADKAKDIVKQLDDNNILLKAVCITHCHSDHVSGLEDICRIYESKGVKLKVYIHQNDREGLVNENKNYSSMLGLKEIKTDDIDIVNISDGYVIKEGNIELEVMHTPGHTNGCVIFIVISLDAIITGDTIFSDCYGRVDLESGNIDDMKQSIDKIFNKFDNIEIYPGHGKPAILSDIKKKIRLLLKIKR